LAYKTCKNILITCGPTWIPVDHVRIISNISTGKLGQSLARGLAKEGAKVTLLEGPVYDPLKSKNIRVVKFVFYDELSSLLRKELRKNYDVIIHAAAVSDYRLRKIHKTKIRSDRPRLNLQLVPTEKIISIFKRLKPRAFLVGFKLETQATPRQIRDKVKKLFTAAQCDLVVANTVGHNEKYQGWIFDKDLNILARARNRQEMSSRLIKRIKVKR